MNRRIAERARRAGASASTCGRLADAALCEAAVQELVDLVLECGGLSDQEALLLLAILSRLERMQSTEGPRAAWAAAREIRQIWLEGDEGPPLGEEPPAALN